MLLSIPKVKSIHCLHLWALTVSQALVSVHLAIGKLTQPSGGGAKSFSIFRWLNQQFLLSHSAPEDGASAQSVLQEATDLLNTKFGFYSVTIQVELYSEDMTHCSQCKDPSEWWEDTAPGLFRNWTRENWQGSQWRSTLDTQSCVSVLKLVKKRNHFPHQSLANKQQFCTHDLTLLTKIHLFLIYLFFQGKAKEPEKAGAPFDEWMVSTNWSVSVTQKHCLT